MVRLKADTTTSVVGESRPTLLENSYRLTPGWTAK